MAEHHHFATTYFADTTKTYIVLSCCLRSRVQVRSCLDPSQTSSRHWGSFTLTVTDRKEELEESLQSTEPFPNLKLSEGSTYFAHFSELLPRLHPGPVYFLGSVLSKYVFTKLRITNKPTTLQQTLNSALGGMFWEAAPFWVYRVSVPALCPCWVIGQLLILFPLRKGHIQMSRLISSICRVTEKFNRTAIITIKLSVLNSSYTNQLFQSMRVFFDFLVPGFCCQYMTNILYNMPHIMAHTK